MNELKKKMWIGFFIKPKSLFLWLKSWFNKGSVSGDTRFDRVKQIKNRDNL